MICNEILVEVVDLWRKFPRNMSVARRHGLRQVTRNLLGRPGVEEELQNGEFWALKNVSLQLARGESIGILGLNGAGKSTLLKTICGLQLPNKGVVRVRGQIDSLIELGTGFHANLSGRENIFIRAAFNGLNRRETEAIYDEIVDFAELHEFIDMPVRNYSSGMYARLGFACAIVQNPDILVVDEVLSVGDFSFRRKCLKRMAQIKERCAFLFVSHDFSSVRSFCDRGIVLSGGSKIFDGSAEDAIDCIQEQQELLQRKRKEAKAAKQAEQGSVLGPTFLNEEKIQSMQYSWLNDAGRETCRFATDENINLQISFRLTCKPKNLLFGVPVWNSKDEWITAFASDFDGLVLHSDADGYIRVRLRIDNRFNPDTYRVVLAVQDGPEYLNRYHLPPIEIVADRPVPPGSFRLAHRWHTLTRPTAQEHPRQANEAIQ